MLGVYTQRTDSGLGRLSVGFLGAGLLYGGLFAIFLLQEKPLLVEKAPEPDPVMFWLAPPPPAAAPPLGGGATARAAVQPEVAPRKTNLAPKTTPRNTPEAAPKPSAPSTEAPATVDLSGPGSPFGEEWGKEGGIPGGIPDGVPGGSPDGVPGGIPGNPPGNKAGGFLPDEGGPIPLKPGMDQPKKIADKCPPPEYPAAARDAAITGSVSIKLTVTREGKVKDPVILEGPEVFHEAALASVKACEYEPALFNGHPVAVTMLVRINFSLR